MDHDDQAADFWQDHSIKYLEMAFRTDRQETVSSPDGYGRASIACGDSLELYLTVDGERITSISYAINGCMNTNACANAILDLAQGLTLTQAWKISPTMVSGYLESLPSAHFHCAELAVKALHNALADARRLHQSPWKKRYPRGAA